MGSLNEDSNILDIDAIEDYLGPKGLGLVDFGDWYTSDEDENQAIRKARGQKKEIEERRNAARIRSTPPRGRWRAAPAPRRSRALPRNEEGSAAQEERQRHQVTLRRSRGDRGTGL